MCLYLIETISETHKGECEIQTCDPVEAIAQAGMRHFEVTGELCTSTEVLMCATQVTPEELEQLMESDDPQAFLQNLLNPQEDDAE